MRNARCDHWKNLRLIQKSPRPTADRRMSMRRSSSSAPIVKGRRDPRALINPQQSHPAQPIPDKIAVAEGQPLVKMDLEIFVGGNPCCPAPHLGVRVGVVLRALRRVRNSGTRVPEAERSFAPQKDRWRSGQTQAAIGFLSSCQVL